MLQLIQIKTNGQISILFGPDGPSLNFQVGNPLIPADIALDFTSTLAEMQTNGISSIHMEKDDYRIFTHTIKAGLVEHQDGISNTLFVNVMNNQDELVIALNPPSDPILPPADVPPADPIPADIPPE